MWDAKIYDAVIYDTLIQLLKKKKYSLQELVRIAPSLQVDPEFWRAYVASKDWLPLDHLPVSLEEIWAQDAELALQLCAHQGTLYQLFPMNHPLTEKLLEVYLVACPCGLCSEPSIPVGLLRQHPHLVAGALERLPLSVQGIREAVIRGLPEELWQQPVIVLAWAKGGGNLHEAIPDAFKDDGLLMNLFSRRENKRIDHPEELLPSPSDRLLSDKQFMMGIVVENPRLLFNVGANLVGDTDLVIAALSGPAGLYLFCGGGVIGGPWYEWYEADPYPKVAETVREKLQLHDIFLKLVLGGDCDSIRSSLENGTPLGLYKLLSGVNEETSLVFKRLLAEYIGVPTTKKELEMLRGARHTLALAGFHWPDHVKCSFVGGEDRMQVD